MKCLECNNETSNPKFCSRSCSATYNNRGVRRHGSNLPVCPDCGGKKVLEAVRCQLCHRKYLLNIQLKRTLGNCINYKYDSSLKYVWVRKIAQRVLELSSKEKKCKICGFNMVVNVCHIKPISEFSLDTKLLIINSLDNLIYLCPNHHAMLDRKLLEL